MALLSANSWNYCDFARSDKKTIQIAQNSGGHYVPSLGGAYWSLTTGGPTTGTKTGSIGPGPYPGTSSLHLQQSNPVWYACNYFGQSLNSNFIVGRWIYPMHITGTKTIIAWQEALNFPNYGQTFIVQIRSDGKVIIAPSIDGNPNLNNFGLGSAPKFGAPAPFSHFPGPSDGPTLGISNRTIPINTVAPTPGSTRGWTHISIQLHCSPTPGSASCKLYINGCLDLNGTGQTFNRGSNLITDIWDNASGPDELYTSQSIICDASGSYNNTNVSPFAVIRTVFPTSDVLTGWASTTGAGYTSVNDNPGPGTNNINLATLATPDELFGVPASVGSAGVLGVCLNICQNAPTQTMQGLLKKAGSTVAVGLLKPVGGPTGDGSGTIANLSGLYTRQAISEVNPLTGNPWTDADINATAWGVRGVTGISEQVGQLFLEVVSQSGPAQCGGSYAW